jgi:hypothetical protein
MTVIIIPLLKGCSPILVQEKNPFWEKNSAAAALLAWGAYAIQVLCPGGQPTKVCPYGEK